MNQVTSATAKPASVDLRDLPKPLLWGAGVGLIAFVVQMRSTSTKAVNGVVTECSTMDVAALLAAIVCLGCGVAGLLQLRKRSLRVNRLLVLGLSLVLVLLAGVHVLRGVGMIGGPC